MTSSLVVAENTSDLGRLLYVSDIDGKDLIWPDERNCPLSEEDMVRFGVVLCPEEHLWLAGERDLDQP